MERAYGVISCEIICQATAGLRETVRQTDQHMENIEEFQTVISSPLICSNKEAVLVGRRGEERQGIKHVALPVKVILVKNAA